MKKLPTIHKVETVARSRIFHVQSVDLEFSNGERRVFERLKTGPNGAVMILPLKDPETMLLIREYAAGMESYQMGFPKGLIESGEEVTVAANRELREEVGCGARRLQKIGSFTLAPGYMSHEMHLVLAQDLYPDKLEGDEPEPVEVVEWPVAKAHELLALDDFSESRSIAALYLLDRHLQQSA